MLETVAPVLETVEQTVPPVLETVAPVLETVEQTVPPVLETVAPVVEVVDETVPPVLETVAPVLETVDETVAPVIEVVDEMVPPVLETVAPVVEVVDETVPPVLETVVPAIEVVDDTLAPVLETAAPVTRTLTPGLETATPVDKTVVRPLIEAGDASSAPAIEAVETTSPAVIEHAPTTSPGPGRPDRTVQRFARRDVATANRSAVHGVSARHWRDPVGTGRARLPGDPRCRFAALRLRLAASARADGADSVRRARWRCLRIVLTSFDGPLPGRPDALHLPSLPALRQGRARIGPLAAGALRLAARAAWLTPSRGSASCCRAPRARRPDRS